MHFKFKHLQKIIGAFFLLTCAIVITLFVIAARGQRWFQSYAQYVSYFEAGGGLRVGTVVTIKGLEAGRVSSVDLGADNRVKVGVEVFRHYAAKITQGAAISLVQPLIGNSSLEIIPGPDKAAPIARGGAIPSRDEGKADVKELLGNATRLIRSLEDPRGDLMQTLYNINSSSKKVGDPQGDLMQALANLNAAAKKLAGALDEQKGTVGLLLENRELYDKLISATARLDNVLGGIEKSTPEIRDTISDARKDLDEAGKVLRALQKNFFIRGNLEKPAEDNSLRSEGRAQ